MKYPKAKCTCGKRFKFKPRTKTIKGVDIVYGECKCGKRYLSYVADSEIYERINQTETIPKEQYEDYVTETRRIMNEKKIQYQSLIVKVI